MAKFNIEIAHIYVDNKKLGKEQLESISALFKLFADNRNDISLATATIGVWIDDYNPIEKKLDIEKYIIEVSQLIKVDYVTSEKAVAETYDFFRNILDPKDRFYYDNYLLKKKKLPCSLVTAMWYYYRMRGAENKNVFLHDIRKEPAYFACEYIVNVLPKKFANSESKVHDIFKKNKKLKKFLPNIHTHFF